MFHFTFTVFYRYSKLLIRKRSNGWQKAIGAVEPKLWAGSAKYQLAILDSAKKRVQKLIGDSNQVKARLQGPEYRIKLTTYITQTRNNLDKFILEIGPSGNQYRDFLVYRDFIIIPVR